MKVQLYQAGNVQMLSANFGTHRIRLSTGEKVGVSSQDVTAKLKRLEAFVYSEYARQVNPTPDSMKAAILGYLGRNLAVSSQITLLSFCENLAVSSRYKSQTQAIYKRLSELISDFQTVSGRFDFDTVNQDSYDKFVLYLRGKLGRDSSVGAYIKSLKHLLNDAFDQGVSTCIEQKKSYFKVFTEESDQVYLNQDEINAVLSLNIQDAELDHIRNLFVLSCYTGWRYSDWHNYTPDNLIENGTILKARTEKTGEDVFIPVHPTAKLLLDRLFKSGLPVPGEVEANRGIKKIMKLSGMAGTLVRSFTASGKRRQKVGFKSDAVSCHTARRSFATNAYLGNVPVTDIMKFTGHKTETAFRRYIRVDKLQTARRNVNHPFFNGTGKADPAG